MPFCKKCGVKLDDDAVFCPECGTPVKKVKTQEPKEPEKYSDKTVLKPGTPAYGYINLENLPVGYIIDERYEIKEKLGQGGFGAVYRAIDSAMNIDKALKIIPEAVTNDVEAMLDLQEEARNLIMLNHPNIVRVYDFHKYGDIKYIDMEYIDGETLTELKLEGTGKKLPEEKVIEYALQIAEGMSYAHNSNILHKDIKPQNIKLNSRGRIKIMDFGIAETVHTSMSRIANKSSGYTIQYCSPEQYLGKDIGKESDIYSFGAMLYDLLRGHPPFYKGNVEYQLLNVKPEEIPGVSDKMNRFLLKCLEKDYKDRYRSFEEARDELKQVKRSLAEVDISPGGRNKAQEVIDDIYKYMKFPQQQQQNVPETPPEVKVAENIDKKKKTNLSKFLIIMIGIIITAIVVISNSHQKQVEIDQYLRDASSYFSKGMLDSAESRYKNVLELDPDNSAARSGLSQIKTERDRQKQLAAEEERQRKLAEQQRQEQLRKQKEAEERQKRKREESLKNMVFVQGGTIQMGSTGGDSDEKPIHTVTVDDFYIGEYEITQAEYKKIMGKNPSNWKGDDLPVEQVSWYDAVEFCNKLSERDGLTPCYTGSGSNIKCNFQANGYRLPTEAEWEYAARGGNKSKGYKYSGSDNLGSVGWYDSNSSGKTHPVGQKQFNELGIYDMSGNVWEWCWDLKGSYSSSSQSNPRGPNSGSYRVLRGGSWGSNDNYCRVAFRSSTYPGGSNYNFGFRILRIAK